MCLENYSTEVSEILGNLLEVSVEIQSLDQSLGNYFVFPGLVVAVTSLPETHQKLRRQEQRQYWENLWRALSAISCWSRAGQMESGNNEDRYVDIGIILLCSSPVHGQSREAARAAPALSGFSSCFCSDHKPEQAKY